MLFLDVFVYSFFRSFTVDDTGIFRSVFRALSPLPDKIVIVMRDNELSATFLMNDLQAALGSYHCTRVSANFKLKLVNSIKDFNYHLQGLPHSVESSVKLFDIAPCVGCGLWAPSSLKI